MISKLRWALLSRLKRRSGYGLRFGHKLKHCFGIGRRFTQIVADKTKIGVNLRSSASELKPSGRNDDRGRRSYALNQLDLKLLPYLDFRNGFFVEVGANDGINQSNTLYFEKYKGWKGLLIEAIPDLAEKCRRNRPKCIVENCALVASDYPDDTVEMLYCNLMSVVKGGRQNDVQYVQSGMKFLRDDEQLYTITVPAKTLSEVFDLHSLDHIDLLVLDVEGYEAQVLKGIDLERHRPSFMLIEVTEKDQDIIESIIAAWYRRVAILTHYDKSHSDILYAAIA